MHAGNNSSVRSAHPGQVDAERMASLRSRLDELNMQLLALLEARGRIVHEIMIIKAKLGRPAHDPQREQEILDVLVAHSSGVYPKAEIEQVFNAIFAASRALAANRQAIEHP